MLHRLGGGSRDPRQRLRDGPRRPVDLSRRDDRLDRRAATLADGSSSVPTRTLLLVVAGCGRGHCRDLQSARDRRDLRDRGAIPGRPRATHVAPRARGRRERVPLVGRDQRHDATVPRSRCATVFVHRSRGRGADRSRRRRRGATLRRDDPACQAPVGHRSPGRAGRRCAVRRSRRCSRSDAGSPVSRWCSRPGYGVVSWAGNRTEPCRRAVALAVLVLRCLGDRSRGRGRWRDRAVRAARRRRRACSAARSAPRSTAPIRCSSSSVSPRAPRRRVPRAARRGRVRRRDDRPSRLRGAGAHRGSRGRADDGPGVGDRVPGAPASPGMATWTTRHPNRRRFSRAEPAICERLPAASAAQVGDRLDHHADVIEALTHGLAHQVTRVDPGENDGELVRREHLVEVELAHVAARLRFA